MRRVALIVVLVTLLPACREGFFDPTPGGAKEQTSVELIGTNLTMLAGEPNAIRISFLPKDPSARLRIDRSSNEGRVIACGLRSIDDPLPAPEHCMPDVPDGVRESITAAGLGAIVLVREGAQITIDLRLEYEQGGRTFALRLPIVETPPGASVCKDNGCNPFFELLPVRGGAFTAAARWDSGSAKLELLEGRVRAKAFSSTGIPYRIAATRSGASPLSVEARMNAPSEYALALTNAGSSDLTGIEINATWP